MYSSNGRFLLQKDTLSGLEGLKDFIAGSPPLQSTDLPTYLTPPSPLVNEFIECFTNVRTADWIVANSFNALDFRAVEAQRHKTPVYCVGPLNMGFSSMPDSHCTEWLDTKPARSVIYVSFGSFITVARPQVREIADGLMKTGCYFVWALRPDKEASHFSEMLPTGFIDVCEGRGLIAAWFRQAEVLRHPAVGGFLSHCGWNAVMESVSAGVPMLGFPLAVDQFFNCRYIVDEWKFGLGLKNGDDGNRVVRAEEIESKVKMLMEGEESVRFRRAAERFRDLAEEEVSRGGPSATSLEALVNFINLNPQ
ncbi:UDP-glycosyltransferase 86A1 isoform X3 [Cryptomeria japonica]|uniref:UDP-glycosyltransferase 86A1 isoform X3 n=1 Tax=Cryptomeria japonica TaxID=3369 RepID=UPI0027DA3FB3|nr:UDP-glycosyltransferase 86A1 isoform X3 [Cryptomeria japonica]